MVIRKIGGLIRGKATPMQVLLASLLGSLLGFVPVWGQSPGLIGLYVVLLLVLNANIGLALFVGVLAKLLSLAAMPLSFEVGRVLIDGPARGLVEAAVNAPVLALFGLQYYATTGGLVVGAAFGLVLGIVLVASLTAFRKRMAAAETGNERFKQVTGKFWSRFLMWLLIGGRHGKMTYGEMLERGRGKPTRLWGVIVAAVLVGAFFIAPNVASGPFLTGATRSGLAGWTGATVDLEGAELSTAQGRLALSGLAMADPQALEKDVFRARRLEADVSGLDLLRARMVIDKIVVHDAASGVARTTPGERLGTAEPAPPPRSDAPAGQPGLPDLGELGGELEQWKQRIETLRTWVERLTPKKKAPGAVDRTRDRLEQEVSEKGYARVDDDTLERTSPRLHIKKLEAGGVRLAGLEDQLLDVTLYDVSTDPSLVAAAPRLVLRSRDGSLDLDIVLDENAGSALQQALEKSLLGPAQARLDAERKKLEQKVDQKVGELQSQADAKTAELEQKKNEKVDEAKDKLGGKVDEALGGLFGKDKDKKKDG